MLKQLLAILFFQICFLSQGQEKMWRKSKKDTFQFEERYAHVIKPKKSAPGNPWVWRARFPDYHTEVDSSLARKGFHIAYIDTDNLYGSPEAVDIRDRFYQHVISTYNLNSKVALHGHSRGGLFTYNWAKRNPEKVACIYVDAPVCDFKSWPGGYGMGTGSSKDWEQLKVAYGFTSDEEAKSFQDNPIDNLEVLVNAAVPILHTISPNDLIVPPEENTYILIQRYTELGGESMILVCSLGEQKLSGHHYPLDDLSTVVAFIVHNAGK
ncbi:MAG: prolyl oligopeptidase family serine peptidase [Cyclobacteriaceae bacterium]